MIRRGMLLLLVVCSGAFASCSSSGSGASKGASSTAETRRVVPSSASTTAPTASGDGWTTYYGNPERTGVAGDLARTHDGLSRQWTSATLDGDLYAEPLLVGSRVLVGTANDSVYSLDGASGTVQWRTTLGAPVPASSLPCGNVGPVGITSTPVVDAATNRIYVVGFVQPGRHMLFELDLSSGAVVGSVGVDAEGSDPRVQNQRAALTLANGRVFIPYGGRFGDCGDYHGRIVSLAVAATGLGPPSSYTLPTQNEGGFWAPPGASVASDGTLYLASGNSSSGDTYDYGNSVVHLTADLRLVDSFAPDNWAALNRTDSDLGSTGPVLLPSSRVFQIGKSGVGYLLDAQHLGGIGGELHSAAVCRGSGAFGAIAHDGDNLYVPCSNGVVQVTVTGNTFDVGWSAPVTSPGPTIVAAGAVWTVATRDGMLLGLDPASGRTIASEAIGRVPSQFTSAAAGFGHIVVGAERKLVAFGT